MIQIKLMMNGKPEIYRAAGMNMRESLEAYDLLRDYSNAAGDYNEDLLNECTQFITRIFGGAFTENELLECYKGSAFTLIPGILQAAVAYVEEEVVNFPKPPETAEEALTGVR